MTYLPFAHAEDTAASYSSYLERDSSSDGLIAAYMYAGLRLQRDGKFEESISPFQKAISMNPTNSSLHEELAASFSALKKYDQAKLQLLAAIKLAPCDPGYWSSLATAALHLHDFSDAIEAFKKVIDFSPRSLNRMNEYIATLEHNLQIRSKRGRDYLHDDGTPISRWSNSVLPLKVFIDPGDQIVNFRSENVEIAQRAFQDWSEASSDKLQFEFVGASEKADMELIWKAPGEFLSHAKSYSLVSTDSRNWARKFGLQLSATKVSTAEHKMHR